MLHNILIKMRKDIEERTETPEEFYAECVNNRLQKGLEAYNDYLDNSVRYLSMMKEETLVKRIY